MDKHRDRQSEGPHDNETWRSVSEGLREDNRGGDGVFASPESQTSVTPCQSVTVDRADVSLTKSIATEGDVAYLEYTVSSERSRMTRFTVTDHRPIGDPRTSTADDRSPLIDATWWVAPHGEIEFRREIPALDTENTGTGAVTVDVVPQFTVGERRDGSSEERTDRDQRGEDGRGSDTGTERGTVVAALPAYNEGGAIGDVAATATEYADAVLVVDDGSTDDTRRQAWEAGAFVHEHDSNRGYGATLQTIFTKALEIDADHLVVLDSDGQHDPTDIPRLVRKQQTSGAEVVIGNRFGEGADTEMPLYRWFGLTVINSLTNLGVGSGDGRLGVTDSQSGFRSYSHRAVRSLANDDKIGERMEISTDILYHAKRRGYEVAEVGSTIEYDVDGASSMNPVTHGYVLVRNLMPMIERERPLVFLGVPGFLLTVIGGTIAISLATQFSLFDGASVLGTVLAVTVFLTGMLVCVTGLTFHALHRFHEYTG